MKIENPLISFGSYFIKREGSRFWGINITLIYLNFTIFSFITIMLILIYLFSILTVLSNILEVIIIIVFILSIIGYLIYCYNFINSYYKYEITDKEICLLFNAITFRSRIIKINNIKDIAYAINPLKIKYKSVLFPNDIYFILNNGDYFFFQMPNEMFNKMINNNKNIKIKMEQIKQTDYLKIKKDIK